MQGNVQRVPSPAIALAASYALQSGIEEQDVAQAQRQAGKQAWAHHAAQDTSTCSHC